MMAAGQQQQQQQMMKENFSDLYIGAARCLQEPCIPHWDENLSVMPDGGGSPMSSASEDSEHFFEDIENLYLQDQSFTEEGEALRDDAADPGQQQQLRYEALQNCAELPALAQLLVNAHGDPAGGDDDEMLVMQRQDEEKISQIVAFLKDDPSTAVVPSSPPAAEYTEYHHLQYHHPHHHHQHQHQHQEEPVSPLSPSYHHPALPTPPATPLSPTTPRFEELDADNSWPAMKQPLKRKRVRRCYKLWQFILELLCDPKHEDKVRWIDREKGVFTFVQSQEVASLWGRKKNKPTMTYEHLARAIRHYYGQQVMRRCPGRRLVYQFGPCAQGWKEVSVTGG